MRIARKVVLLAMMVVAAMAMTASVASAAHDNLSTEPELHEAQPNLMASLEPANTLCPHVTPAASTNPAPATAAGGCRLHIAGTGIVLFAHVGGGVEVTVSTCDVEFNARIDADAEGWITHAELTQGAAGTCTRRPCGSAAAEGRAWGFHMREISPGTERASVLFCLETFESVGVHTAGTQVHCEIEVPFTEPSNHRYTFQTRNGGPPGGGETCHGSAPATELSGTFTSEAVLGNTGEAQTEQNIEINHTHNGVSAEPELHTPSPHLQARVEPGGGLCPAVTPVASTNPAPASAAGGCRLHVAGTGIVLFAHVGGGVEVTVSTCDVEFDARVDPDAEGWITHAELTQGATGTCTRRPCGSAAAEGRAWGFHMRETEAGVERAAVLFCLETFESPGVHTAATQVHCEIEVPFTEPSNHRYTFQTRNGGPPGGGETCHGSAPATELSGTFSAEAVPGVTGEAQTEQQVEINHI